MAAKAIAEEDTEVVTHQWSSDPSINASLSDEAKSSVVTHQWSSDPSIFMAKHVLRNLMS